MAKVCNLADEHSEAMIHGSVGSNGGGKPL